jgi:hypothetical protein
MWRANLHKVLRRNFVPSRTTFLACPDTIDFLSLMILHNEIHKLALVRFG